MGCWSHSWPPTSSLASPATMLAGESSPLLPAVLSTGIITNTMTTRIPRKRKRQRVGGLRWAVPLSSPLRESAAGQLEPIHLHSWIRSPHDALRVHRLELPQVLHLRRLRR